MKDHQKRPGFRPPAQSLLDDHPFEVGQQVSVTVTGRIVAIRPAGNGDATLKIDTAPEGAPPQVGQWVYVVASDPAVTVKES